MNINYYSELAMRTYPGSNSEDMIMNGALGLSGEAGEFADLLKKHIFHKHEWDPVKFALELGDILWYVNLASVGLGYTLEEIAEMNIDKLRKRYPEGFDPKRSQDRSYELKPNSLDEFYIKYCSKCKTDNCAAEISNVKKCKYYQGNIPEVERG